MYIQKKRHMVCFGCGSVPYSRSARPFLNVFYSLLYPYS